MTAAAAALLVLTSGGRASANGIGDLYVATPAGVLELYVAQAQIVNTIPISPTPTALAFSPDGKQLYVVSDGAHVTPIEIESLESGAPIAVPGTVTALAFPSGQTLVGTEPASRKLVLIRPAGESVTETTALPGAGNLLAGDRHDPRVVVAEAGKSWVEVVDPATSSLKQTTVTGEVRAVAIDRDKGAALVATHNPDALLRLDLGSLSVSETISLPAAPTGVAAMLDGAVVSGGSRVWKVSSSLAVPWVTAHGEITGVAASDEGKVLHVAQQDLVEVYDQSGTLKRSIELKGKSPAAMAPVTAGSSLYTGKEQNWTQPSPGAPGASPNAAGESLPPTSTVTEDIQRMIQRPQFQGAAVVAGIVLVACWLVIRRFDRRAKPRQG